MEKTGEISILRSKNQFKMEKTVKISILRSKNQFKMEKTGEMSILRLGGKRPLPPIISYNKNLLYKIT